MRLKEIVHRVLSGYEFVGPDSFRLEQNDPCHECHLQLSQYLQEMDGFNPWHVNPKMSTMGEKLLDHNYPYQVSLVNALIVRLSNENNRLHYKHRGFFPLCCVPC